MAQIAGFRGALWDASKVELAKVAAAPLVGVNDRLGKGELVRDVSRAMYRYHQTFEHGGRQVTRKMVITAVQLAPWSEGTIRPHEATGDAARTAATKGVAAEGAHTKPVLFGYRDAAREVDRLFRKSEDDQATLDVTTADRTRHLLWRVSSAELIGKIRPLFAPKKLHVLDGHARYEGMLAYAERLAPRAGTMYSSANFGLGCLVNLEDPALVVAPRHRVVRGAGVKAAAALDAAKAHFLVEKLAGAAGDVGKLRAALAADTLAHQPAFVALFAGEADAWKLTLSPDVSPTAAGVQIHRALQKYDPVVVEQLFVRRAFPGAIAPTELDPAAVVKAVTSGGAEAGVLLRPLSIDQVIHADELGQVLPFGSTAFPPELGNLLAYVVDPDEDLV
ncbi:MAG TPA: DUF1015 family protein [Kofleriaceae bacterium]|nr:DUF1015 family protein [Kofleriaceae bacterium]